MKNSDPFTSRVIENILHSITTEQQLACIHSSFSLTFAMAEDFSSAIMNKNGEIIAQSSALAVHLGAIPEIVSRVLKKFGTLDPEDIVIHNDPYAGGTHHSDISVIKPIYFEGQQVAIAINRGHQVDMGGMSPACFAGDASDVIQEGFILPATKLYQKGKLIESVKEILLANVRSKKEVWGDLQAQLAACLAAERGMIRLMEKYGIEQVSEVTEEIMNRTEKRFRRLIDEMIPDGEYVAEDYMDDDGHDKGPFKFKVKITKETGKTLLVDFSESDKQVKGPINTPYADTLASTSAGIIQILDPHAQINQGFYRCLNVIAPKESIVNPVYPAPLYSGNCDSASRVNEVVLRALSSAIPDRSTASDVGTNNNMSLSGIDPRNKTPYVFFRYSKGGGGGRNSDDGCSHVGEIAGTRCKDVPIEHTERRYPIVFEKSEFLVDSGGAGKNRGGIGTISRFKLLGDALWSCTADKQEDWNGAWGLFGGKSGMTSGILIERNGKRYTVKELFNKASNSKFSNIPLKAGDIMEEWTGGGGGHGDPKNREKIKIENDIKNSLITMKSAKQDYYYDD